MAKHDLADRTLYCDRCGISFLWTREEQKQRTESAPPPKHCPGCRRLLPQNGRERGLVKWFNSRKRFGFVLRADEPDVFVHRSALLPSGCLQTGDLVEFSVKTGDRGPVADTVTLVWRE